MSPSESAASPDRAGKTIRLVRPSVVVLSGPAACGKSTFAARHFRPTQIISSDHCRALVSDDERDQRFQPQAFALLHAIIEQRLSINRMCVVDSTALTPAARWSLLDLARKFRVPCVAVVFDVPIETCVARDRARASSDAKSGGRSVGESVIERQYQLFELAKPAIRQEGFDQVIELADADLDRVEIEVVFRPAPRQGPGPARPEPRRYPRPAPVAPPPSGARGPSGASARPQTSGVPPESAQASGPVKEPSRQQSESSGDYGSLSGPAGGGRSGNSSGSASGPGTGEGNP
jgi:predicted kinase